MSYHDEFVRELLYAEYAMKTTKSLFCCFHHTRYTLPSGLYVYAYAEMNKVLDVNKMHLITDDDPRVEVISMRKVYADRPEIRVQLQNNRPLSISTTTTSLWNMHDILIFEPSFILHPIYYIRNEYVRDANNAIVAYTPRFGCDGKITFPSNADGRCRAALLGVPYYRDVVQWDEVREYNRHYRR